MLLPDGLKGRLVWLNKIVISCALVLAILSAGSEARANNDSFFKDEPIAFKKASVFDHIEQAYLKGEINEEERVYYSLAAIKAPHLLPSKWREVLRRGLPSSRSYTSVFVEAAQMMLRKNGVFKDSIQDLLQPPTGYEFVIEVEEPLPFRVFYDDSYYEDRAQMMADAMVFSHETIVDEWGFWPPSIDPDLGAYHIYVDDTGMGGGAYTAPYAIVQENPRADMYTYIVMDKSLNEWSIPGTMAHEYNHACQASMDVLEPTAFWENTATYIMSQVYPASWNYTMGTFHFFQSRPYRPLEYMIRPSDMYEYGGGLWVYFMSYLYGEEDPKWIREIWEGCVQDGYQLNFPHYFGVLDEELQPHGGFEEMVKVFSEYRYFASEDDDGQHLPGSGSWWDSSVSKEASFSMSNLPVLNRQPVETTLPQQNGCNYIEVKLSSSEYPILFQFDGEEDKEWFVRLMGIESGKATLYEEMILDEENFGSIEMDVGSLNKLVMVVCHMGGEGYDPNIPNQWEGGDYEYSIYMIAPEPQIHEVIPSRVERGTQNIPVTILGEGFMGGDEMYVRIGGEGLAVSDVQFISTSQIEGRMVVAASAELGVRDVYVSNPGGEEGKGEGLLEVVDSLDEVDGGSEENGDNGNGGCNCRAGTTPGSSIPFLPFFSLGVFFFFIARKRSASRNSGLKS